MSLCPFIIVGCGGAGGRVVVELRRRLAQELKRRGWSEGIPAAFQLKCIDTPWEQEILPPFGERLPVEDYLGLAIPAPYEQVDRMVMEAAGNATDRLTGWRPRFDTRLQENYPDLQYQQMRGIGRMIALANAPRVRQMMDAALRLSTESYSELNALANHVGVSLTTNTPIVILISSLSGGTGAGILLDICDILNSLDYRLNHRTAAVLLARDTIVPMANHHGGMASNELAALSELMNSMLDSHRHPERLLAKSRYPPYRTRVPVAAYVLGVDDLDNSGSSRDPSSVHATISDALMGSMLDEVFDDFLVRQFTHQHVVQCTRLSKSELLWIEPSPDDQPVSGLISSFGSARVSVGSSRFGVWARDRMVRSVFEYLLKGWRDRGLELVDPIRQNVTQDPEIVDRLVSRDSEEFFDKCGLWEEDEPDGTRHDQVVDGVMSGDQLKDVERGFHQDLILEMRSFGQLGDREWVTRIPVAIRNRQSDLRSRVAALLETEADDFADAVVGRLESAVSKWLSEYGLPVAVGLVKELSRQCESATQQCRQEASEFLALSEQDPSQTIEAAFQSLGGDRVDASSSIVDEAVRKGIGPIRHWVQSERCGKAASLLMDVVEKVLCPLASALEVRGRELDAFADSSEMQDWPAGSGVSAKYEPAPSEFCLVEVGEWNRVYEQLLKRSAGSVEAARNTICAGGFDYGHTAARHTAPTAVYLDDGNGWAGRDGHPVKVGIALNPEDLMDRAERFLLDPSNSMGRFMEFGLAEYLAKEDRGLPVADHAERLERFQECLSSAIQMASPLCRINEAIMSRVHLITELDTRLTIQEFPFDRDHPAHDVAKRILTGQGNISAFKSWSKTGMESVLIMRWLELGVHPAVVASLYQPIVRDWDQVVNSAKPVNAIQAFWNNKRARLLQEFIPLQLPATESIVRGWFVGRLLGLITDPTPSTGPHVHTRDEFGREKIVAFPWPLLRHGQCPDLHDSDYRGEWLPALLEHLPLAMMMLSQDELALGAYEETVRLGRHAGGAIRQFITQGTTASSNMAQVSGNTQDERQIAFKEAIDDIRQGYLELDETAAERLSGDHRAFRAIPFGHELFPVYCSILDDLHRIAEEIRLSRGFG